MIKIDQLAAANEAAIAGNVEHGMKWLCEACKAGRFGSTQSTVLALRAIKDVARALFRLRPPKNQADSAQND